MDKDGVRAAVVIAELYIQLQKKSKTFQQLLSDLYDKYCAVNCCPLIFARYGYHTTLNSYFFCYEPDKMAEIFAAIRNSGKYHSFCGEHKIAHIRDLTAPGTPL